MESGATREVASWKNSSLRDAFSAELLFCCLLFFALMPLRLEAATFTVNSRADLGDLNPGDGNCVAYLFINPPFVHPFCTLRAAIEESNSLPGADRILLSSGRYLLESEGIDEDENGSGDLDILDSVTIIGQGVEWSVVDGNGLDRVFDVHGAENRVELSGMTLQNGRVAALADEVSGGGAIRNRGDLVLREVQVMENRVDSDSFADGGGGILNLARCYVIASSFQANAARNGGAIRNGPEGVMEIERSTLERNQAVSGGGVLNEGRLVLHNVTVSNNILTGTGQIPQGAALQNGGDLELIQSTVAENRTGENGVAILSGSTLVLANSLIIRHGGHNCLSLVPLLSAGGNLDDDGSCQLSAGTDLIAISPMLGPLADNGGPTRTHALLPGSPAIDHGQDLSALGIISDQRGVKRPQRQGYDIGAYEKQPIPLPALLAPLLL